MSEEKLRKIRELREEYEKAYAEFKGLLEGIRIGGKLTPIDKSIMKLLELMITGFKNVRGDLLSVFDAWVNMDEKIDSLEKKTNELEESINQLRTTWDNLADMK